MKNTFIGFEECMALMRKSSPQQQEDGFHCLLPHAHEYVDPLILEFKKERDHGLKCWLMELIGEAKSEKAISFFADHLHPEEDTSIKDWAIKGLIKLNSKAARTLLFSKGLLKNDI